MSVLTVDQIERLLEKVRRPSRYINSEINSAAKNWDESSVRWCLIFPDTYEIGMSHVGLEILYHILNADRQTLADRAYAPWIDMEGAIREQGKKLWGLESKHELCDFDVLGFNLSYELTYTNVLNILDLAGLPVVASERGESAPLVIAGGVAAFNPAPMTKFIDAFVVGDGEEVAVKINVILKSMKGRTKHEKLSALSKLDGLFVPSVDICDGVKKQVARATVADLNNVSFTSKPIVPFMQVIHDRCGIEIARGCCRGCRFCQAGYIYRPVRERDASKVQNFAMSQLDASGNEELSFLSLSAGDYTNIPALLTSVANAREDAWTNISLPSLRVETLTPEVIGVLKRTLGGGFTLAPEAATERLRAVINKGNTEADLISTVEKVVATGWRLIKLYFMIGLPTETEEDVRAIAALAHKVLDTAKRVRGGVQITVSVSTFVPKSHTPFQWCAQMSLEETLAKQQLLQSLLRRKGLELKWHSAEISYLEGIFARGDEHVGDMIFEAWKNGARFDAWDETFKYDVWLEAAKKAGIDPKNYVERARDLDEKLPWDNIFSQLDKNFLKLEYQKAIAGETTPECFNGPCSNCGVCDAKSVKLVKNEVQLPVAGPEVVASESKRSGEQTALSRHFVPRDNASAGPIAQKFTFQLAKTGILRWLSHLELMQALRRAIRRSGLKAAYSQGFHPHMKMSVDPALKVGQAGSVNVVVSIFTDYCAAEVESLIQNELPTGLKIISNNS